MSEVGCFEVAFQKIRKFLDLVDRGFTLIQALGARFFFFLHGLLCISYAAWCVNDKYWWLCLSLLALLVDTLVVVKKTRQVGPNREWKWVCPCVFCYLLSAVPPIWIVRMNLFAEPDLYCRQTINLANFYAQWNAKLQNLPSMRINDSYTGTGPSIDYPWMMMEDMNETIAELIEVYSQPRKTRTDEEKFVHVLNEKFEGFNQFVSQSRVKNQIPIVEASLMFVLIIGRWMLPKGALTRDELSLLLLVYIGMAADIVELFDMFLFQRVAGNKYIVLCFEGVLCSDLSILLVLERYQVGLNTLSVWTASLLQFTLVKTVNKVDEKKSAADKFGRMQRSEATRHEKETGTLGDLLQAAEEDPNSVSAVSVIVAAELAKKRSGYCYRLNNTLQWAIERGVWSIVSTLIMQDVPFLVVRMVIMLHFEVVNQALVFFTSKNLLVILMQVYRLLVLWLSRNKEQEAGMEALSHEFVALIRKRSRRYNNLHMSFTSLRAKRRQMKKSRNMTAVSVEHNL